MQAQARKTILRRFNLDRNHRLYLEIYREMTS